MKIKLLIVPILAIALCFVNLAYGHYPVSPYAFCNNDPIDFVDPDGRDIWEINQQGEVVNRTIDRTHDIFHIVRYDDGDWQRIEGKSLAFEYGTIKSHRNYTYSPDGSSIAKYDVFTVQGDDNGTALFTFMADNITQTSEIEVSQAKTGVNGDKGLNFITNGHQVGQEPGMTHLLNGQLFHGYTIRELNHSHPYHPQASGNDQRFARRIIEIQKDRNMPIPMFNIYYTPKRLFIPFY